MPGTVIGTQMNLGYPGTYSRNGDCVIAPRLVKATDSVGPNFGAAVVLNEDSTGGTVSDAAVSVTNGNNPSMTQGLAAGTFVGVAVREVLTMTTFNPAPTLGNYLPGTACDVLERGSIIVQIQNPTAAAVKAGGKVFLRIAAGTGAVIGAFEPVADGGNTIQVTNAFFTTGLTSLDANGNTVAEITLLSRNTP